MFANQPKIIGKVLRLSIALLPRTWFATAI